VLVDVTPECVFIYNWCMPTYRYNLLG